MVTFAAVLTITSAGALYVYLGSSQPQPVTQQPASSSVKPSSSSSPSAVPNVTEVGSQTVTNASAGEVLSVIATTPTSGGTGASPRTPIQLSFNLSVDPVAAQTYFSVLPAIEGTFSQGRTPQDIVFTPSGSFGRGSSVTVVLRKGYMSRDGYALEDDYTFSFKTALSRAQVVFQVGDQIARLHNVPSGRSVTVTLQFGDHVPADTVLETFRATSGELLTGFVHSANGSYRDRPIPTATMQSVARVRAVNGRSYTFTQPAGIYLVLAANSQAQYGAMWLDFSRFGVILRQDDQKIVGAGLDLTTGSTDPTFDITFYSLRNEVEPVLSGSFTGRGEFAARYPAPFEMAVATSAGEDVVIPLGIPQTNADIKVVRDLSEQPHIFLTTDRAGPPAPRCRQVQRRGTHEQRSDLHAAHRTDNRSLVRLRREQASEQTGHSVP